MGVDFSFLKSLFTVDPGASKLFKCRKHSVSNAAVRRILVMRFRGVRLLGLAPLVAPRLISIEYLRVGRSTTEIWEDTLSMAFECLLEESCVVLALFLAGLFRRRTLSGCRHAALTRGVSGTALCTADWLVHCVRPCVCTTVDCFMAHETIICRYAVTVSINTFLCLSVYWIEYAQMTSS